MIIQFCKIDFNNAHKKKIYLMIISFTLMTSTANISRGECSLNVSTYLGLVGFITYIQESPYSAN